MMIPSERMAAKYSPEKSGMNPLKACLEIVPCKRKKREVQLPATKRWKETPSPRKDFVLVVEKQSLDDLINDLVKINTSSSLASESCNGPTTREVSVQTTPDPCWYNDHLAPERGSDDGYNDKVTAVRQDLPLIFWDDHFINTVNGGLIQPSTSTESASINVDLTPPHSTDSSSVTSSVELKDLSNAVRNLDEQFQESLLQWVDEKLDILYEDGSEPPEETPYEVAKTSTFSEETSSEVATSSVSVETSSEVAKRSMVPACYDMEVKIVPIQPTHQQLQHLYERQQQTFRDSFLRPKRALKRLVPFTTDESRFRGKPGDKMSVEKPRHSRTLKKHNERKTQNSKRRVSCHARLIFATTSNKDVNPKVKLKDMKVACKLRNSFSNALDSINVRIQRQNMLWRMLSG